MRHQVAILITVFALLTTTASAQWGWGGDKIKGEGPIVSKTLDLGKIHGFGLAISGDVFVKQGSTQSIEVKGQANIIDRLVRDVDSGYWKIKLEKGNYSYEKLEVYITITDLEKIGVSGSGDVEAKSSFTNLDELVLAVSGSGSIEMDDVEAEEISARISGSGDIEVGGTAEDYEVSISGSGDVSAFDLKTKEAEVRITGSGDCKVHADEELDVRIVGSGDVYYKGTPNVVSRIVGSGDIHSRN